MSFVEIPPVNKDLFVAIVGTLVSSLGMVVYTIIGQQPDEVNKLQKKNESLTSINDQMETRAIKKVFGKKMAADLAISSTKSMVGHCLGAAGAIEAGATVLTLYRQTVPPTIHLDSPDPDCDLDYVPNQARTRTIRVALSNSFAFGGNNTSLVFRRA